MFNYFLPGATKETIAPGDKLLHELLRSISKHLADALDDVQRVPAHASVLNIEHGPGGLAGMIIAPVMKHRGPPSVFFNASLQHWEPAHGGRYWIGYVKDDPISAQDLERWETTGGIEVADDTRQQWQVPIARAPHFGAEYGTLPQSYTFNLDSGEPESHLMPSWEWLWELAGEVRDWYRSQEDLPEDATPAQKAAHVKRPFTELVRFAGRIVGVNYRVTPVELNILHKRKTALLTQRTVHLICQACYGWQVNKEADESAKKNSPANDIEGPPSSSPSIAGADTPAAAPGIDQAAAH